MIKIGKLLVILIFSQATFAEDQRAKTWVDLPLIELPFNSEAPYYPALFSMRQSLRISNSYYQNFHYLIAGDRLEEKTTWVEFLWLSGFDLLGGATPMSNGWVHEEWHRSVLTRRKFGSFNDMNTFPFGKSWIAVSHVDDQDLVDLKKNHPAEQVRLSSAGMEAQVQQNLSLEENLFFRKSRSEDTPLLILNAAGVVGYISTCATADADKETENSNRSDGIDISRRDFTGLDCTAWVYDLFRPDEPYSARGNHPSGVGLDRYIKYSDLSDKEKEFLKRQSVLAYLNFADPFLLGYNDFQSRWFDKDVRWNLKLSHMLTSFGGTVDANLFLDIEGAQYLAIIHNGMTDTRYLPGITLKRIDMALSDYWSVTPSLTLWQQPDDQRIENTKHVTVVDAAAELAYKANTTMTYYLGLEAKNEGWIAGNVYLDNNVSTWAGFRATVF